MGFEENEIRKALKAWTVGPHATKEEFLTWIAFENERRYLAESAFRFLWEAGQATHTRI